MKSKKNKPEENRATGNESPEPNPDQSEVLLNKTNQINKKASASVPPKEIPKPEPKEIPKKERSPSIIQKIIRKFSPRPKDPIAEARKNNEARIKNISEEFAQLYEDAYKYSIPEHVEGIRRNIRHLRAHVTEEQLHINSLNDNEYMKQQDRISKQLDRWEDAIKVTKGGLYENN